MTTIDGLPTGLTREGVIRSLASAVTLANTSELLGNGYASGFNAYDRWITTLRDVDLLGNAGTDVVALVLGNAHIFYCLIDARSCAVAYLRDVGPKFVPEANPQLMHAADIFERLAQDLNARWDDVPWPWQLHDPSDWKECQRHNQAASLSAARELEWAAVGHMEEAVAELK